MICKIDSVHAFPFISTHVFFKVSYHILHFLTFSILEMSLDNIKIEFRVMQKRDSANSEDWSEQFVEFFQFHLFEILCIHLFMIN